MKKKMFLRFYFFLQIYDLFTLNCFVCESSCTIFKKAVLIWIGFRLDWISSFVFVKWIKSLDISWINDVNNQQNPQKKHIGSTPIIDKLKATADSTDKAIKYPIGVFQLNGTMLLVLNAKKKKKKNGYQS